jgi:hypothetical protein
MKAVDSYGVEIIITSSSRPKLFKQFWESFESMVFFNDEVRITIHEDFRNQKQSIKIKDFILSNTTFMENKDHFFMSTNPAKGVGKALDYLLNHHIRSKYVFFLEDDWVFEKPIYIDKIVDVMEKFSDIQQIILSKQKINTYKRKVGKEVVFDGIHFTEWDGWTHIPNVFRVNFVRKYWNSKCANEKYPESEFGRGLPRDYKKRKVYFIGRKDDERYVKHIGEGESTY